MANTINNSIILKVEHLTEHVVVEGQIRKYNGYINAKGILDLLSASNLKANPRSPSINQATEAIRETLKSTPELMCCKSKGLLISCKNIIRRDRNRLALTFGLDMDSMRYEDVLDGAHNLFAISTHIIESLLKDNERLLKSIKQVKEWAKLKAFWIEHAAEILPRLNLDMTPEAFPFMVPVEILTMSEDTEECENAFISAIYDISQARNNNVQLANLAKGNQRGYFDIIKESLPEYLRDRVQWTTGESDKDVKGEYVLVLVAFIFKRLKAEVDLDLLDKFTVTATSFYSGRGKCASMVQDILGKLQDLDETDPQVTIIRNSFKLLNDLPKIWDAIELAFPSLYNAFGGGDGKSGGCYGRLRPFSKKSNNGKDATLRKDKPCRFRTPEYVQKKGAYETQDGYAAPLHYSIMSFMKFDKSVQALVWRYDVQDILNFYTAKDSGQLIQPMIKQLGSVIVSGVHGDPQLLGKLSFVYDSMDLAMQMVTSRESLK